MREIVILICSNCLSRNYTVSKRKGEVNKRIELKKYCPTCNAHTIHKESK